MRFDWVRSSEPCGCASGGARLTLRRAQAMISRIEQGHLRLVTVDALLSVAEALEIRIDWTPRWRGGDLDRMLNAGHSAMHVTAARMFRHRPWLMSPETTFAIYGERGVIDLLCFHPPSGALLVIELKTDLVDVQNVIAAVDRYRRLAPQIARERGWTVRSVSCWVMFRDTPSNRRRVAVHASVLRVAFPHDGRTMRRWLRQPDGQVSALSFIADAADRPSSAASSGVQRIRRRSAA